MDKLTIKIPDVLPIADNQFVTVPSESWNALCSTLNNAVDVINLQSEAIRELQEAYIHQASKLERNSTDINKLAMIVEGIYETLE